MTVRVCLLKLGTVKQGGLRKEEAIGESLGGAALFSRNVVGKK